MKFVSGPYTIQYVTIIDENIISSSERVLNVTYLAQLRLGSNWYTQTGINEVIITLPIIVHSKLNVFPGIYCIKSQRDSFFSEGLIQNFQLLHEKSLMNNSD